MVVIHYIGLFCFASCTGKTKACIKKNHPYTTHANRLLFQIKYSPDRLWIS
uniref:Uncharacterized protein n=1 Tax=Anguilla anguilla TaxID=7936 RepID=A0A0E9UEQ6_ANGAN